MTTNWPSNNNTSAHQSYFSWPKVLNGLSWYMDSGATNHITLDIKNGKVERKHRQVVEFGISFLAQASLPLKFWWHSFITTTYPFNRLLTPTLDNKSPFEIIFKQKPNYKFLRVFKWFYYPLLQLYNKHKLSYQTIKCAFFGYSNSLIRDTNV